MNDTVSLRDKLKKVIRLCRRHRHLKAFFLLGQHFPRSLLRIDCFLVLRVDPDSVSLDPKKRIPVRLADKEDVRRSALFAEKREEHLRRLRNGHVCAVAEVGQDLAGYVWGYVTSSHHEETLDYDFRLGPRDVWLHDGYVEPRHRRKGVGSAVIAGIVPIIGGNRLFYALVKFTNDASLRMLFRLGFKVARRWIRFDILGFRFISEKPPAKAALRRLRRKLSLPSALNLAEAERALGPGPREKP